MPDEATKRLADGEQQAIPEADPFDSRPAIVIRPSEQDKMTWGVSVAFGMAAAMGAAAWLIAKLASHETGFAILAVLLAVFLSALTAHAFGNPPNTIGLNLATKRYQVIKGSGRFRHSYKGDFTEIAGISVKVEESSHGVSGYTVLLKINGPAGSCTVEKLGPRDDKKADGRAAKLATILGVTVLPIERVAAGSPKR